jgi:membrane fusion protein (multidrug efflux system)
VTNTLLADGRLALESASPKSASPESVSPESMTRESMAPARAKTNSRKTMLYAGTAVLILIGAIGFGLHYWIVGRFIESTDDAYVGGDVTDLAPRVDGLITEVAVHDNQAVRAGDLLVKIDDRDYQVALAKAQAERAGDQARLANLNADTTLQQALIDEAKADVSAATAQAALARANQTRYRILANTQAASLQDSQTADATLSVANANATKAQAALAAAQAQLTVIDTEIQQTAADLAGARADIRDAELNIGYTEIRAPVAGVIGNRSAHLGGYATIGAQLVSIVPSSGLWVDANFKEDQLAGMTPGEPVTIVADVLPGAEMNGVVASLAPATGAVFSILPAENATGNFTKIVQRVPVRILLQGDASQLGLLRPGLSVTAYVDTRSDVHR